MATKLTLSSPIGYVAGAQQTSGPLVGFQNNQNNVLRYSFTTPKNEIVKSLTFATTFRHIDAGSASATYYVRVKVTDSATSHINAGAGAGYDASFSLSGAAGDVAKSCTISGLELKQNTTYYIYLFPGETYYFVKFCYDNNGKDLASLTAETIPAGQVFIDNGSTVEAYQAYIDNGSSWDLYMPYIDNGSKFELCS
jgi:hypothetical protein